MFVIGDVLRIKNIDSCWKHLSGKIGVFVGIGEMDRILVQFPDNTFSIQFNIEEVERLCHINDLNGAMHIASRNQNASTRAK